jgi:spore maturation protein A
MLNYVWISLVAVGILVAAGNDVRDEIVNPYRNGIPFQARIDVKGRPSAEMASWEGELVVTGEYFQSFYRMSGQGGEIRQAMKIMTTSSGASTFMMNIDERTPEFWKRKAAAGGTKDQLKGTMTSIRFLEGGYAAVTLEFEPVHFIKLRAVTQAALDYAATAVTIALGLIGIMALWLGVMKVAEEAGLIRSLTRLLTPLTKWLFPEIPPDHPAVGAMIMNISANMLGLSNAATPFGLKAMEELNKLNPKVGTATNAMCTFLTINTAGLVLIPATAIAVRAAAGSANPGIIIGTSIFGAGCATVAGLIAVKLLQRLPRFRRDDPAALAGGKEAPRG